MTHPTPSLRALEAKIDARRLRQLAAALTVFGAVGLAVLVLVATVGVSSFGSIAPLGNQLESERQQIVTILRDTATAVRSAGSATTNAGTSLGQARDSAAQAAELSRSVATTMRNVATASQVEIFGTKPLGGLVQGFADAATQSEKLATTLDGVSTAIGANSTDIGRVRGNLDTVASEIDQLSSTVETMPPFADAISGAGALRWVFALLVLWLMLPAIAALASGIWLWRWLDRHEGRAAEEAA